MSIGVYRSNLLPAINPPALRILAQATAAAAEHGEEISVGLTHHQSTQFNRKNAGCVLSYAME